MEKEERAAPLMIVAMQYNKKEKKEEKEKKKRAMLTPEITSSFCTPFHSRRRAHRRKIERPRVREREKSETQNDGTAPSFTQK